MALWFLYPGPFWRLTAVFSWISTILALVICAPIFLMAVLCGASLEWQTRFMRNWFRWVMASCFLKVKLSGNLSEYNPKEPCLVVTNHQSMMDIPVAIFAFQGNLRMVAKRELFWIPFFGQAMSATGMIPLFRGNKESSQKVLNKIKRAFSRGVQVWVAPEGTRSKKGELGEYRWGAFGLAISAQVPIQPIVVLDSWKALPKTSFLPRVGSTIHAVVLSPISTKGLGLEDRKSLAEQVHRLTEETLKNSSSFADVDSV